MDEGMKVYLAALFSRKDEMGEIARQLEDCGFIVVSSWVFGGEEGLTRPDIAIKDFYDVDRADMIVSFTHPRGTPKPGGGRHVEFGYAFAKGKQCVIIGPRENVFHEHPKVLQFDSLEEFLNHFHPSQLSLFQQSRRTLERCGPLEESDGW